MRLPANSANIFARLRNLRRVDVVILLLIFSVLAMGYGFIELADDVLEGDTQSFDEWLLRSMRRTDDPAVPIGPSWMRQLGIDATALGSVLVLALVVTAVVGFMLLQGQLAVTLLTIVATSGGVILSLTLKQIIGRVRPTVVPHLQEVTTPSFPSGHAMLSAVVYLTLGILVMQIVKDRATKLYCLACACLLTFIVGTSRIYLGVHYPTDVLAGWMVGIGWAIACSLVAHWMRSRHQFDTTPN
jgi:undecaprenyl-diphosphatase